MISASPTADLSGYRAAMGGRVTQLCLLATVVGLLLATGTTLRIGAMTPSNLFGQAAYFAVFSAHSALTLTAMFAILIHFGVDRGLRATAQFALVGFHAMGACIAVFGRESAAFARVGCALCLATIIVFGLLQLRSRSWKMALFALATLAQLIGWCGALIGWYSAMGATLYPLVVAVLAGPLLKRDVCAHPLILVAIVAYLLTRTGMKLLGLPVVCPIALIAGTGFAVTVFRSASSELDAWSRWTRRIEAVLFVEAVFLITFLGILDADVHLHQTLFAVGAAHLEAFVLVFALLRGLSAAGNSVFGWIGLVLTVTGAHGYCWGSIVVGGHGMPRHYLRYLPEFTFEQLVTSEGALVMVFGLVVVLAAWAAGRRSSQIELLR
jgi:hypothetical protein